MIPSPKIFNDSVHGMIEMHPLCVKIIDTPQFQRLRFIKQLGLSYFVYPAAAHNRFEHSLGTCHLAGQLVRALKDKQPDLGISDRDILCVELAGLCHDLGHGPFSHLWEKFMQRMRPNIQWKHESASVAMLEYLIQVNQLEEDFCKYNLTSQDLTFIKELICKPCCSQMQSKTWPYLGRGPEKGFLYQVIANDDNGVDVDKWDYVLRDKFALGLQVMFSYSRLIKFARVFNMADPSFATPELKICFRDKETTNIFNLFYTRMILHRQAYQHRVVTTIDIMIVDAFELANGSITYRGHDGRQLPLSQIVDDMAAMTFLHDDVLHRIYCSSDSPHPPMAKARQILHNLFTRQLYPSVGQTLPLISDIKPEILLQKMAEKLPSGSGLTKEDLHVHKVMLDYANGKENPLNNVGFFTKDHSNVFRGMKSGLTSNLVPTRWQESSIRVVCRRYDADAVQDAMLVFSQACDDLGIAMQDGHNDEVDVS